MNCDVEERRENPRVKCSVKFTQASWLFLVSTRKITAGWESSGCYRSVGIYASRGSLRYLELVLNAAYHNKSRDGQGVVDGVSEQRPAGQSDGLRHKETQRPYLTRRQWTG